jgi:hypothetical protein
VRRQQTSVLQQLLNPFIEPGLGAEELGHLICHRFSADGSADKPRALLDDRPRHSLECLLAISQRDS